MLEQDMYEGMEKDTQKSSRFAKASWCKRIKGFEICDATRQSTVYRIGIGA